MGEDTAAHSTPKRAGGQGRHTRRIPNAFSGKLEYMGAAWCDAEHRTDVADFFTERSARIPDGPRVLSQVMEELDLCIARKEAQGASIDAFLTQGPVKAPASH